MLNQTKSKYLLLTSSETSRPRVLAKYLREFNSARNAQGAVILQQKFCDPHEADVPAITESFKAKGIPTLFLELDVTVPVGQFKTRADAFLEMISADELF